MIYATPEPDPEDQQVLEQIHGFRTDLADVMRVPKRWLGGLRRSMLGRAIQGSNSIEGHEVRLDDAVAALDDEEALSVDERTFAEIRGYRQALGYVLAMAGDAEFELDVSALRGMHFMMLSHDLSKSPGSYRQGAVYVHDEASGQNVYEGPPAEQVPALVAELMDGLGSDGDADPLIRAAMAHLNLVMIHPFRDGNGRMARALQTLVLSRGGIGEPAFSGIEEWLGSNAEDYCRVLAATGDGGWHPDRSAALWVKFNLRAHHIQAQTIARRYLEAGRMWQAFDDVISQFGLPERVADELFDAALGFRIRRSTYVRRAAIEQRTATRDLARLAEVGLLVPVGETKGRHYVMGERLAGLRQVVLEKRVPLVDPYPWMRGRLASVATPVR
ncbi:Fic family protein [Kribbella orskensis]|uniref:Fic family protein n=1 Tax=Kribbella orskensis TaxID=2512216 RepID=A0ABY2BWF8_9ACTN|nr:MULTISPECIES: Fic family protein [Kribbella]TCN43946.1 Fic family protein [Kribbella sp. VKM Ac-2500]TCO32276.1 Fic family protein [Kribbella orskensis]